MQTPSPNQTNDISRHVQWSSVLTFFLLACALAAIIDIPLWVGVVSITSLHGKLLIGVSMYTPAAAAVFTVVALQGVRGRKIAATLGWSPVRPLHRTTLLAVAGLFGSILIPVAAVFLAALLGVTRLDLHNFSGYASSLKTLLPAGKALPMSINALVIMQLIQIPVASLFNSLLTVGEETGWRGFLLPALKPLGTWPALIITGIAWGLWHTPVILLGYNFNQPNLYGMALMTIGCLAYGILIGWLRIHAGNIWPSVIAHGAFNAAGGFYVFVVAAGSTPNLIAIGPLGWSAWIIMGILILVLALTRQIPKNNAWSSHTDQTLALPSASNKG